MEHDSDYFHKGLSQWIAPRVFIWRFFFSLFKLYTRPSYKTKGIGVSSQELTGTLAVENDSNTLYTVYLKLKSQVMRCKYYTAGNFVTVADH